MGECVIVESKACAFQLLSVCLLECVKKKSVREWNKMYVYGYGVDL